MPPSENSPHDEYHASYFDREYFELHPGKGKYLAWLVGELYRRGIGPGARVLDVGSGYGFFLEALAAAERLPTGLELVPHAAGVSRRRNGLPVAAGSAEDFLPFADGSFDAVTQLDVIEHVDDWERSLAECARVLRPGGLLLVLTLNRWSFARPLLGSAWSWHKDPTHIHMFSPTQLAGGFERAGLAEVSWRTVCNFCSVGESTPWLKPLRSIGRVVPVPWVGDSVLVTGRRAAAAASTTPSR